MQPSPASVEPDTRGCQCAAASATTTNTTAAGTPTLPLCFWRAAGAHPWCRVPGPQHSCRPLPPLGAAAFQGWDLILFSPHLPTPGDGAQCCQSTSPNPWPPSKLIPRPHSAGEGDPLPATVGRDQRLLPKFKANPTSPTDPHAWAPALFLSSSPHWKLFQEVCTCACHRTHVTGTSQSWLHCCAGRAGTVPGLSYHSASGSSGRCQQTGCISQYRPAVWFQTWGRIMPAWASELLCVQCRGWPG